MQSNAFACNGREGVVAAKVSFLLEFLSFCILSESFFFDLKCEFVLRREESVGT